MNKTVEVKQPMKIETVEMSDWRCYLFGSSIVNNIGFMYTPIKGTVPNWFIRWMMKICLGCTWVKT